MAMLVYREGNLNDQAMLGGIGFPYYSLPFWGVFPTGGLDGFAIT